MDASWINPANFRRVIVQDVGDRQQVQAASNDYCLMLLCVVEAILARAERDPAYPFINTKLSLLTGQDAPDSDPLRGRNTIFGWIQGRGLEALAGHDEWIARQFWLDEPVRRDFHRRITRLMRQVLDKLERVRAANGGRLFFMMTPEGWPLKVDELGRVLPDELPPDLPHSLNDLFYCKGMAAAAWRLGDDAVLARSERLFAEVLEDIRTGRYYSDQQQLDPRNPVKPVPGRCGHGSRMITIGAATRFLSCTGDRKYIQIGLEALEYILRRHVQHTDDHPVIRRHEMWEFTDPEGNVFVQNGVIWNDPGHATELAGLGLRFLDVAEAAGLTDAQRAQSQQFRQVLRDVLVRNFENGFSPRGFGLVKSYDLAAHKPINDHMPWWNLPETIRGAVLAARGAPAEQQGRLLDIAARCSNAFVRYYVRPDLHLMAYQTIDAAGRPVDVIPATPDADPAYHTGLSIIDALDAADDM